SSRRRFLQVLAVAGIGTGLGEALLAQLGEASPQTLDPAAEHQWAFVIDLRRCDGCGDCTKACQKEHYLSKDQKWINVYKMTDADGQDHFMPRLCMQCENAPCLRVCPVGATFKTSEGVVLVDQNKCIGCRMCMAACPYEARYFNWSDPPPAPKLMEQSMPEFPVPQKKGTVGKCILCVHNTKMGKLPACVNACSMKALYIGDMKADVATNGAETVKLSQFLRDNDAVRYREELGTQPRVWYILGHAQNLNF
ncbi:MAG TPA: 4Fe-4S dicluster domain-containing protein, partial [Chloroflexota bacterium]|nr:4Fe-4S dicluster domain-containing protein [Chloroflexota bacterium]